MNNFTPIASAVGGALIGLSAAVLLLTNGKIAGVSGIAGALVSKPAKRDRGWRVAFLAGLLLAGVVATLTTPARVTTLARPTAVLIAAGLLVGFGTRIGNGCTSGHGVCGLSRLSVRSLFATVTFMTAAGLTVFISNHVLGGMP